MNISSPQTAAATGNALRGEPAFKTVNFPTTGDNAIDAISGCLAVLEQCEPIGPAQAAALFQYLSERFKQTADDSARNRQYSDALKQSSGLVAQPYPWPASGTPCVLYGGDTAKSTVCEEIKAFRDHLAGQKPTNCA